MATLTGPTLRDCYQWHQFRLLQQQLVSLLRFSRSQAILLGRPVKVVLLDGQAELRTVQTDQVLRVWRLEPRAAALYWRGSGPYQSVIFTPTGGTLGQQGSYWLKWKQYVLRVVLTLSGRIRVEALYPDKVAYSW